MDVDKDPSNSVHFRRVLSHFATGLTVITSEVDGHKVGFTCQSFSSVSLDPPLVAFFSHVDGGSWACIRKAGFFCVNVLSEGQEYVSRVFAMRGADKFHDVETHPAPSGAPIIDHSIAWIDCTIENVVRAGDHDCVIGRVQSLSAAETAMPLLYFRGGYGQLGS